MSTEKTDFVKISEVKITDAVTIVVSIIPDKKRVDVREFITTKNYTGATKKGINVPVEHIDEIMKAVNEAVAKLQ
ncbi:MAG: hypothetical protein ACE5KA_09090 [Nitrososphaerales archaeon]